MSNGISLRVAVAGGGSWGSALAHLLATCGHTVHLVVRDLAVAEAINSHHENFRYLPGLTLHSGICAGTDPAIFQQQECIVLAIPCQQVREWLRQTSPWFPPGIVLVNTAKGMEIARMKLVSQIIAEELAPLRPRYAVLSGPSFAAEVLRGHPTAVVLGCRDDTLGASLRHAFSNDWFRCYSSTDVTGVELGGALKNIIAIAAGICDGLGLGSNSRAALITRGLAEMCRIGIAHGAQERTFMGLSGLGDLTLTCTDNLSRNRQVGLRLGRGEQLDAITHSLGMVAEGVKTTEAVYRLVQQEDIPAPITTAMYAILHSGKSPRYAVTELMTRTLKEE